MKPRPRRWTDLDEDPEGFIEIDIVVTGPRVVAEMLDEMRAATASAPKAFDDDPSAKVEDPCRCDKCRVIRARVLNKSGNGRQRRKA